MSMNMMGTETEQQSTRFIIICLILMTDGAVSFQREYGREYDVSGNLTKEWNVETFYYDNRDDVRVCCQEEYEYEYKCDADGHRIAFYYDTPKDSERREYDENGKETVCYIYSPYYGDGEVTFRLSGCGESEYDEYGNLKVYSTYYYNKEMQRVLDTVKEYKYDQDGNCIAEYWCSYSADGEPEDWFRYEYNENGDETLMADGYGEFYTTQWIFEYDERGMRRHGIFTSMTEMKYHRFVAMNMSMNMMTWET